MKIDNVIDFKYKFIVTIDEQFKDKLLSLNYSLVSENNGCYTFENKDSNTLKFDLDEEDKGKYILSDKLFF